MFGNRGKSETGGKCIIAFGGGTPLPVFGGKIHNLGAQVKKFPYNSL